MQFSHIVTIQPRKIPESTRKLLIPISLTRVPRIHPLQRLMVDSCADCDSCSQETASRVFRDIGNLEIRTKEMFRLFLVEGVESDCKRCTAWYFQMAEILEMHARMLHARRHDNVQLQLEMARLKSKRLFDLGYEFV
jgi:hypothetical protein